MLESQRSEMMEAMGVKILLPRFQLAAAKPSDLLVDQAVEFAGETEEQGSLVPSSKPGEGVFDRTVADPVEPEPVVSKSMPATIAQELNALVEINSTLQEKQHSQEKALKFRYRIVRVGELMMLLDQPAIEWQEAKEVKQFFADIYWALTGKKPEYWSDAQFDWPPSKHFPYSHDREMARQTLHSFMQEQMQQPSCAWILVWGSQLAENIFESVPKVAEVGFINEASVLMLDSVQYYWQNPASKHLLWQSLQVVKKSLVNKTPHE